MHGQAHATGARSTPGARSSQAHHMASRASGRSRLYDAPGRMPPPANVTYSGDSPAGRGWPEGKRNRGRGVRVEPGQREEQEQRRRERAGNPLHGKPGMVRRRSAGRGGCPTAARSQPGPAAGAGLPPHPRACDGTFASRCGSDLQPGPGSCGAVQGMRLDGWQQLSRLAKPSTPCWVRALAAAWRRKHAPLSKPKALRHRQPRHCVTINTQAACPQAHQQRCAGAATPASAAHRSALAPCTAPLCAPSASMPGTKQTRWSNLCFRPYLQGGVWGGAQG